MQKETLKNKPNKIGLKTLTTSKSYRLIFTLLLNILFITVLYSQSSGDYQSNQTGDWNSTSTWQIYNGSSWVAASSTPTSANGVITILNGHIVTITAQVYVNQTVVEAGGTLTISSASSGKLRLYEGDGYELTVNGTLINNYDITSDVFDIIFASGSKYQHGINGENIPIATWDANSTIEITGVTSTVPQYLNQSFGNFTWNCSSQTADLSFNSGFHTFGGNFTIASTGSNQVHFTSGESTTVTIGGNFVMTGGTLQFAYSGSSRQMNIAGDFSLSGGTLELGGESGSQVGTLNISGDFSHTAGTITETGSGSGVFVFDGTGTQTYTSGGTISNTINFTVNNGAILEMASSSTTVDGGGTFTLSGGATLGVKSLAGITSSGASGNIQVTGTRTYSTAANYIYNGAAGAQVPGNGLPATVNNLTVDNSSGLTMTAACTVHNTLYLTSGTLNNSSYNVIMANAATISPTTGTLSTTPTLGISVDVIYNGSTGVSTGNELPVSTTVLNDLTINNSGDVTLSAAVTVNGVLTLTDGSFITDGTNLLTMSAGSSVSGASNSSFVSGPVAKIGSTDFTFPIGKDAEYHPISVTSLSGSETFTAQYYHAATHPTYDTSSRDGTLDHVGYCEYWTLSRAASGNAWVTLSWDSYSCGVDNLTDIRVARWDGSELKWKDHGNGGTTGSGDPGTGTVQSSGILTNFSTFTLGSASGDNPLPIELLSFTASCQNNNIILKWSTASETNNDYFTIERSIDGINFEIIGKIDGAKNSTTTKQYSFIDKFFPDDICYYRLKQTDFDGKFEYSKIITVNNCNENPIDLSIYPNPSNGKFTLLFTGNRNQVGSIEIYNLLGKRIYFSDNYQSEIDLSGKPLGIYFIHFNLNSQTIIKKIVIE